ncbi:protein NO VEIN domain-containing protein [Salinibacterium sp. NK8237]|uniref:protein NO VEIN domain-containing protein n=1 Tax=Salinibacterium sp. NK8237 TaxID=2792038 RepID=UPI0018CE3C7D|nr:DUF3883 domain-containing protein [Salinibacterium sp. NK8237]MBH0129981.1 DUF3883 domain-containing protein [Salinibacterium sp. NK8237]
MPKYPNQKQRIADASPLLKARFESIAIALGPSVPYQITRVLLGKAVPDAVQMLRNFLSKSGIYDYESQELGAEKSRFSTPMKYLRVDIAGAVFAIDVVLNLYRSDNRGRADRRFSISWSDTSERFLKDEFVVFALSPSGQLLLINVSAGLAESETSSMPWLALVDRAMSTTGTTKSSGEELAILEEAAAASEGRISFSTPQGFIRDVDLKRKIERHSLDVATRYYDELGASDIEERGRPYDLHFDLNGQRVFVEVKGSQNRIDEVFVTYNEVEHANENKRTELFVVDDIECKIGESDDWVTSGGRIRRWLSWKPTSDSLKPIQYRHTLSVHDEVSVHSRTNVTAVEGIGECAN